MTLKKLVFVLLILVFLSNGAWAKSSWTMMIFMNGDNDLEPFIDVNLKQIEAVLPDLPPAMNITVQRVGTKAEANQRLAYSQSGKQVFPLGTVDMGDYRAAINFAQWSAEQFPADHYFFVFWNHGNGWQDKTKSRSFVLKGVSYADSTGNMIKTVELRTIFDELKKDGITVDVVGFDACLMQMLEIGYEMKDSVDMMIGSEETIPGEGWPYDAILKRLPDEFTPTDLATAVVEEYLKAYAGESGVTMSAMDLSKLDAFLAVFDSWANSLSVGKAVKVVNNVQSYSRAYLKDLYHFGKLMGKVTPIKPAFKSFVIKSGNGYGDMVDSYGMAVYLPASGFDRQYDNLDFAKEHPAWRQFIKAVATKRE